MGIYTYCQHFLTRARPLFRILVLGGQTEQFSKDFLKVIRKFFKLTQLNLR